MVIAGIAFRIYKADAAGMTYDEVTSFVAFGTDVQDALTKYPYPNNHVLNSVLIHYSAVLFLHDYIHFARLPALVFGGLYVLAMAVLIPLVIRSRWIQLFTLLLSVFISYFVDLTILARGYVIGVAAIYWQIALLCLYLRKVRGFRRDWVLGGLFILLNFVALGGMLSTLFFLGGTNAALLIAVLLRHYRESQIWNLRRMLQMAIGVGIGSLIPIVALYYRIYDQIREYSSSRSEWYVLEYFSSWGEFLFWEYFIDWMKVWFFNPDFGRYGAQYFPYLTVGIIALVLVVGVWKMPPFRKKVWCQRIVHYPVPAVLLSILSISLVLVYASLELIRGADGYPRNYFFLGPLLLVVFGVSVDFLLTVMRRHFKRQSWPKLMVTWGSAVVLGAFGVFYGGILSNNLPSAHAVRISNWHWQSMIWPLVKALEAEDPNRWWSIHLSEKLQFSRLSINWYYSLGYKMMYAHGSFDTAIYHASETSGLDDPFYQEDFPYVGRGSEKIMPDFFQEYDVVVEVNRDLDFSDYIKEHYAPKQSSVPWNRLNEEKTTGIGQ